MKGTVWQSGATALKMVNMKATGLKEKQMVKANSHMLMAISTKACGRTIKLMGMEHIFMQMGPNTLAIGRTTYSMVKELNTGLMDLNMSEGTKQA